MDISLAVMANVIFLKPLKESYLTHTRGKWGWCTWQLQLLFAFLQEYWKGVLLFLLILITIYCIVTGQLGILVGAVAKRLVS